MNLIKIALSNICILVCVTDLAGQDLSAGKPIDYVSTDYISRTVKKLEDKYSSLESKIIKATQKSLDRLKRNEKKIIRRVHSQDPVAANSLSQSTKLYDDLLKKVSADSLSYLQTQPSEYLPVLDSMQTSLAFIESNKSIYSGLVSGGGELKIIQQQVKQLDASLQTGYSIKNILKNREAELKSRLGNTSVGKYLKMYNREAYYYQEQIKAYKEALNNSQKLEEKIIALVRDQPGFKDFMSRNSQLGALFRLPGSANPQILPAGLQSRTDLLTGMVSRLGSGGDIQQLIDQGTQLAQGELQKLKNQVGSFGNESSNMIIPDFKPNSQRVKSLWKRLEFGFNIQSLRANLLLPATSDLTITAGYKVNDKSTIGVGVGYKLGWGTGLDNIRISNQGLSLRSFVDIKLKGNIWLSGGYEGNFQKEFASVSQLKELNDWQRSGLIGVTKKYKIGKKSGNLQLLWDFLSTQQVPQTTPLKFRVGYVF